MAGAVQASTLTAADGTYLFGPQNVGGGIPKGVSCTLSIDSSQAALDALADQGSDQHDSDGTDPDQDGI